MCLSLVIAYVLRTFTDAKVIKLHFLLQPLSLTTLSRFIKYIVYLYFC